jgi:hypothetical protein
MFVQQIPCAGVSVPTAALVATNGLSGLGARVRRLRRRGVRGVGNYLQQSGALASSDIYGSAPSGGWGVLPGVPVYDKALAGLGCSCRRGMGDGLTFDGTGLFGSGLFSGGLDVSNWTWAEYLTLGLGAYVLTSVFHTTRTATRAVRRKAHAAARA